MASRQGDDDKGFLSRWSQRKRAAEEEAVEPKAAAQPGVAAEAQDDEVVDPKDLPDIDSLDAGSDYTVFMKKGVPPALRRKALNKLWQTDPAFRHICMLDDYNLDYTDAAMVVPNLKTLFQVGRGMVLPEEEEAAAKAAAAEAADAQGQAPDAAPAGPAAADDGAKAPESAPAEAVAARPKPRLPGTPLVSNPTGRAGSDEASGRASAGPRGVRSARQRRWGDPAES